MASIYPQLESESALQPIQPNADDAFVLPTSVAQQRFWLLDQLEPGNTSLNMPLSLGLTGKLDVVALERTINEIVKRHETLRTTFIKTNGKPVQVVVPEQPLSIDVVDLSDCSDCEEEVDRVCIDEAHTTFDLVSGPLFRAKLIRVAADNHILLLTLHHIICDGWSNGVLVREIGEIYDAFSNGRPSPHAELPIQYADFAAWQEEWLKSSGFDDQLAYWKEQLGNELPSLDLPTDFPRNKNRASFGAIESALLPPSLTRAIKMLGQRQDATPYMIFLTAFNILLHRYSGQNEILVGSPTANRQPSETEPLIGAFANTLLLRNDLSGEPTFTELLERVKEVSLGAFSNQTLPFEKLVESIRPSRNGPNRGRLFQVLFIFQTAFMQPIELNGLSIKPIRSVSPGSIFELSLGIVDRSEGTRLQLEYNTELFKAETIRNVLNDLQSILHSAVLDKQKTISELIEWTTPLASRQPKTPITLLRSDERTMTGATIVEGRNDGIEDDLSEIWKDVLHLESISIQDDFFEVGGHSLLGAQLFDEISKRIGVNLSLATLFRATTIQQLAILIREEKPKDNWTSLVPINKEGASPPLFLIHAAGGNVLFYKDLADRMGSDQPVYGMQAVGLDGHQSAYDRIEDMASHYIREIKKLQPNGPYYVAGASLGGLIAFEIGCQFRENGEEAALITLFDTYAPGYPKFLPGTSRLSVKFFKFIERIEHHITTIWIFERGKRWPYVVAKSQKGRNQLRRRYKKLKTKIARGVLTSLHRPLPEALIETRNNISVAAKTFRPRTYDGDMLIFRASKQLKGIYVDETLGWSQFAKRGLEIHEVKGNHGSIVVEPRVRFAAELLKRRINETARRPQNNSTVERR